MRQITSRHFPPPSSTLVPLFEGAAYRCRSRLAVGFLLAPVSQRVFTAGVRWASAQPLLQTASLASLRLAFTLIWESPWNDSSGLAELKRHASFMPSNSRGHSRTNSTLADALGFEVG
jgi:hypothetical protein